MIITKQAQNLSICAASLFCVVLSFLSVLTGNGQTIQGAEVESHMIHPPAPPAQWNKYSAYRTGPFEVAKIFGRSRGCQDVDAEFIEDVNNAAVRAGLDSKIFASTIAVESGCDQFAVSSRGAIGYAQVVAAPHKKEYDFSRVNLFNRADNLRVGAEIEAGYIQQYGVKFGVDHYQGLAKGCPSCDDHYTEKVLGLAKP
jgi:transglycosylase-like protein with SLT domain